MDENFYLAPSHMEVKRVHEVQFEVMSAAKTMEYAVCQVTKPFTLIGDVRVVGGLSDLRMGSTDRDHPCATCNMRHPECPGHFGYADLAEPMFNIGFFDTVLATLRCVCQNCGKLLLSNEKEAEKRKLERTFLLKGNARLREISKISPKGGKCPSCQFQQARLGRFMTLYPGLVIKADKDTVWYATDAYRVLDKVSMEDSIMLGFDPRRAHPRDLLIKALPIPPPAVRPAVSFGSGVSENELTAKLTSIIRLNERLAREITDNSPSDMIASTRRMLQADLATYFNNASTYYKPAKVSQTSKMQLKSIYERLKGKQGRLRGNLMGKRVNFSARTVITGDPNIDVDEVGVPFSVAMTLTFPERVNHLNRHRLTQIVRSSQYPSANAIVSNSGTVWRLNGMKPERRQTLTLEIGDIVERQVLNGDVVLFNRQPTLHRMSMMGHRVRVLNYNTFRLNLSCTTPYNADFDGDEMNLHVPQSLLTKAELIEMMMVPKNFVSPNKSAPCMGIVQDSLLGSWRITDKEVFLDKYFVQNVFMWLSDLIPSLTELPIPAILKPRPLWTGKQMFSLILRETNITRENLKKSFPHDDAGTLIRNGDVLVGQVDKGLIGASPGSFIHVIFNDRGSDAVAQFINGVQRLTTHYLYHFSFSVGVQDTLGDENTLRSVKDMIADARKQVRNRGSAANEKKLTRRAGMTLMGSFEFEVNSILNNVREKASPMVKNGVHRRNSFRVMVDAGSKGSPLNIYQIVAAVGQQNIFGARIPFYFRRRTLPHFMLDDYGDASKGHVSRGYVEGLKPYEFFFHTMGGREGLIDTAVKTAETGYFQRKLVKAMEDLHVAYDGTVRNADQEVVQFTYGEDGLDGARIESNEKIDMVFYSDKTMQDKFKFEYSADGTFGANFGGVNMAPSVQAALKRDPNNLDILDSEFKALMRSREAFRSWLIIPGAPAQSLPVNLTRVIRNAQIEGRRSTELTRSNLNPINIIQDVRRLLDDLSKCHPCTGRAPNGAYTNPHSQERVENALRIFSVHVQSMLASKRVINEHKLDAKSFELVLKQIRLKYLQSVLVSGEMIGAMTAQSCGEPATQMTLNTFHNAGISSKNVTLGVPRLLELLSVSKQQRISSMAIHLVKPWNRNRDDVPASEKEGGVVRCAQTASRYLEFTTLESVTTKVQIIFDPDPDNSVIVEDREQEQLDRLVRGDEERRQTFGDNYSPWVVRLTISGDQLLSRSITNEDITVAIRAYGERSRAKAEQKAAAAASLEGAAPAKNPFIVIASVTDANRDSIIRIRLSEDLQGETIPRLKKEIPLMLATIPLRGIPGVTKVFTGEANTFVPDAETGALNDKGVKSSILETEGTALLAVYSKLVDMDGAPICDWRRTASDNIPEIFRVLGVEAARQKLLLEIRNVYQGYGVTINYRHYSVLCDTMCHRGYLMAVSRVGVNRSNVGPLMRCSFEETVGILMKAAAFGERDNVRGVSANLILGNQAKIGTGLFDLMLDLNAMSRAIPQADATRSDTEVNIYHGPSSVRLDASAIPMGGGDSGTLLIHDNSIAVGGAMQSAPFDSRLFASTTASSDQFSASNTNSASRTPGAALDVQSILYSPVAPQAMGFSGKDSTGAGTGGSSAGGPSSFSTASVASSHGTSVYDAYAGDNFTGTNIPGVGPSGVYGGIASDVSSFGLQSSAPYGSVYAPSLEHTDYLSNPYAAANPATDNNNPYGLASSAASSSQRHTIDSASSRISSAPSAFEREYGTISGGHSNSLRGSHNSHSNNINNNNNAASHALSHHHTQLSNVGNATVPSQNNHLLSHQTNSTVQHSRNDDVSTSEFSAEEQPDH